MDLVDEIIKFSSVIWEQEDDPLRAGLVFRRFDGIETHSDYDNAESTTTMGPTQDGSDHEALSQKVRIYQAYTFEHVRAEGAWNVADGINSSPLSMKRTQALL